MMLKGFHSSVFINEESNFHFKFNYAKRNKGGLRKNLFKIQKWIYKIAISRVCNEMCLGMYMVCIVSDITQYTISSEILNTQ